MVDKNVFLKIPIFFLLKEAEKRQKFVLGFKGNIQVLFFFIFSELKDNVFIKIMFF